MRAKPAVLVDLLNNVIKVATRFTTSSVIAWLRSNTLTPVDLQASLPVMIGNDTFASAQARDLVLRYLEPSKEDRRGMFRRHSAFQRFDSLEKVF